MTMYKPLEQEPVMRFSLTFLTSVLSCKWTVNLGKEHWTALFSFFIKSSSLTQQTSVPVFFGTHQIKKQKEATVVKKTRLIAISVFSWELAIQDDLQFMITRCQTCYNKQSNEDRLQKKSMIEGFVYLQHTWRFDLESYLNWKKPFIAWNLRNFELNGVYVNLFSSANVFGLWEIKSLFATDSSKCGHRHM